MFNETFYIDGIDARSVGVRLQSPIKFSEAKPAYKVQSVLGRNGGILIEDGYYKNRTAKAECFVLQRDVEKAISSAGRFLMGKKGYRRLETSDDPDHYWLAMAKNSPQIEIRKNVLAPFKIDFDCKPQRFLKSGENSIVFTDSGVLFNQYGQNALPIIKIYGEGAGRLTVGDCIVDVKTLDGTLCLDSDTQNAYNNNGNQNLNINAPTFPVLGIGETNVSWNGGIERVEVIPRWWEL